MSICYVTTSGSRISFDSGYLVIKEKEDLVRKIPIKTLDSLILFGRIHLTTPVMQELLRRNIPISLFSKTGNYYGRLVSTSSTSAKRLKLQVDRSRNQEFCLSFAKSIIEAKVNNQIVVLSRYAKKTCQDSINRMKIYRGYILLAPSENELLGYEGMAAREYFQALSQIIHEDFRFDGRTRQPPKDPFNSMLSLGYTILMYEIFGLLENRNLSPYIGFFHKDDEKHPTLASDLLEEWRAPLIDSTALSLIQQQKLTRNDFTTNPETGGVLLSDKALRMYISELEKKMSTPHKYLSYLKEPTNFRRSIYHQVVNLLRTIEENDPTLYTPIRIR